MDAEQIRRQFLTYMADQGHVVITRAPLVPLDDPTTLFTGSGMQPLLPYLLGADHPSGPRLADSQTCLRAQDIEEVGDNRHTTFFEMLGNWSLGDYFKERQIPQIWRFLTEVVGLDPNRLYVTCFSGDPAHEILRDEESAAIWSGLFVEAGVSADQVELGTEANAASTGSSGARISFYGKKNWWCRDGSADKMSIGEPGGPDSEMFYLFPDVSHDKTFGDRCHPNCDCGRYIEIGNSVFMEYRRTASGFEPLPRRNVDFGGGLARIAAAAINTSDIYRISLLWPIIAKIEELSGQSYEEQTSAMRVIADHLRGAVFLAVDGIKPSNKTQGYVMRRLIRRAVRSAFVLGLTDDFVVEIVTTITGLYTDQYPELLSHHDDVIATLAKEEKAFRRTLAKGLNRLGTFAGREIGGQELFELYDSFGFPVEISVESASAAGIAVHPGWRAEFDTRMDEQRRRSARAVRQS